MALTSIGAGCASSSRAPPQAATQVASTVISSRAQLQRYLSVTLDKQSPLNCLSPLGRARFLDVLEFNEHGVTAISTGDIDAELSDELGHEILALFGVGSAGASTRSARNCGTPYRPSLGIAQRFDAFMRTVDRQSCGGSGQTACREPQAAYGEFVAPGEGEVDMAHARYEDVDLRFRAAEVMVTDRPIDPYARDMRAAYAVLEQRGEAKPRHHIVMQGVAVATRDFATARRLHARHPDELPALPLLHDAFDGIEQSASAWVLTESGRDFGRAAQLIPSTGMVIVGDPRCHFSRNAAQALREDGMLASIFERHAVWLSPPARRAQQFSDVAAWNREHPTQKMRIAFAPEEWKEITDWATPQFYFFRDGKLVAQVEGWPREGNLNALREAVRSAGLE